MSLDKTERTILACLADVMIPAGQGFPSASEAGVAGDGLDLLLAARPDLETGLKKILSQATQRGAAEFLAELQSKDPASFNLLTEAVPGAYFLNPAIRSLLGYQGQEPHPIDPKPDHVENGLLQSVIDRGPIFRPTPGKRQN